MATSVISLLNQHPTNPIQDTYKQSASSKSWAKAYHPTSRLTVHTSVNESGSHVADFDYAFMPEYDDEELRLKEHGYPPNYRKWRLDSEADGIQWFHSEVSNITLSAFASFPSILQASHEKPLSETQTDQTVDISYSISNDNKRMPLVIGEFKRGLLRPAQWRSGKLGRQQSALSQELRGYAYLYECPLIFCFDIVQLMQRLLARVYFPSPDPETGSVSVVSAGRRGGETVLHVNVVPRQTGCRTPCTTTIRRARRAVGSGDAAAAGARGWAAEGG